MFGYLLYILFVCIVGWLLNKLLKAVLKLLYLPIAVVLIIGCLWYISLPFSIVISAMLTIIFVYKWWKSEND